MGIKRQQKFFSKKCFLFKSTTLRYSDWNDLSFLPHLLPVTAFPKPPVAQKNFCSISIMIFYNKGEIMHRSNNLSACHLNGTLITKYQISKLPAVDVHIFPHLHFDHFLAETTRNTAYSQSNLISTVIPTTTVIISISLLPLVTTTNCLPNKKNADTHQHYLSISIQILGYVYTKQRPFWML